MNKKTVFNELNKGRTCVFHNEVIARHYAIEYALQYGVLKSSRAISYDTFKQFFLSKNKNLLEVTDQVREFFIIDFLQNNKLKYLINNEYPESINRFTSYLVNILKQLKRAVESSIFDTLEEEFKYDVNLLYSCYNEFLRTHNLFEPSYENVSLDNVDKDLLDKEYSIIAADTKVGCKEFINSLKNPSFIHLINVEDLDTEDESYKNNFKLLSFNNIDEVHNTLFREIKKLLEGNILARDIAITLCSFDKDIQDIELGAKKFCVPISKAKGYSLSKYPGGKYLIYLANLYENNFALDDMKSFFLERAFPFEDFSLNRELIRYALDANIDHGSNKYELDYWLIRLRKNNKLYSFYKKFKNLVIKINTSHTVKDLRVTLLSLENLILKKNKGWIDTRGEESYRYAIDKLDSINTAMQISGTKSSKQLFKLYIKLLEKENYVEQGKRDGVKIFEYPLSASLDIPYHFVVDLNSKTCEVVDKPLSLLPPTVEDLELRQEEDLTNNVIKDYCFNSGLTYFFYSETNYDGAQIAPSAFMENNTIQKHTFNLNYTPYIDEIELWGSSTDNASLTHFQSKSINKAINNILKFSPDGYVNEKIEKEVNEAILEKIKKDNSLNFSATSINLFTRCPYAFALKYLFGVQKQEYNVVHYSAKDIGTVIHEVFQIFFTKVMKEDKQFYSSNKEKYILWLEEIKNDQLQKYFDSEKAPPFSTQVYILDEYKNFAQDFINMEIEKFNTCRSDEMEQSYVSVEQININDKNHFYSLNGKIDRVVNLGDGEFAIVDYKTGNAPIGVTWYKKAYEEKRVDFPDYQFPCYKKLLEKKGGDVVTACYYSTREGKYFNMWDKGYPEELEDIDFTFNLTMHNTISKILSGDFIATPSQENCKYCDYRQVCRTRYSTK